MQALIVLAALTAFAPAAQIAAQNTQESCTQQANMVSTVIRARDTGLTLAVVLAIADTGPTVSAIITRIYALPLTATQAYTLTYETCRNGG